MNALTPYRMPIRLWSTVVSQDQTHARRGFDLAHRA